MAGSDNWSRTQDVGGAEETAAAGDIVMLAIVYGADNSITIYRNGQPYGSSYVRGSLRTYAAGDGQVLLGLRHGVPGGNRLFSGQVDEARLYDRPLTAQEIAGLLAPRLAITRAAGAVTISWPAGFAGYVLESSDRLSAVGWDPVPGVANNSVTLNANDRSRFFQLRKP
jgi:hypothetical protein